MEKKQFSLTARRKTSIISGKAKFVFCGFCVKHGSDGHAAEGDVLPLFVLPAQKPPGQTRHQALRHASLLNPERGHCTGRRFANDPRPSFSDRCPLPSPHSPPTSYYFLPPSSSFPPFAFSSLTLRMPRDTISRGSDKTPHPLS